MQTTGVGFASPYFAAGDENSEARQEQLQLWCC